MERYRLKAVFSTSEEAETLYEALSELSEQFRDRHSGLKSAEHSGEGAGHMILETTDPVDAFLILFSVPGAFPL